MARCLVTGGAGFIGSHLVDGLLRDGHYVHVLDDLTTGSLSNLEAVKNQLAQENMSYTLDIEEGSILDAQALAAAMSDIDYVFHQAARPSVAFSLQNPLLSNQVNAHGTLCVLTAAHEAGVKRLIYAGSSSAYGNTQTLPKREDLPTRPRSPYAVAKLSGEHYCSVFNHIYDLETVVLRYFNVFGARQNPASLYAAVIPKFIMALLKDEPLQIFGDGHQSRDFTHVSNVVHGNIQAMTAPKAAGQVINLANGDRTSLRQLISYVEDLCSRQAHVEFLPPRAGDVLHSQADITLAKEVLSYESQANIREGLRLTIDHYQRQYGRNREAAMLPSP